MEEEVSKLSLILSNDVSAFENWRIIYDTLKLPAVEAVILSRMIKNGTIKSYELFREIIQSWKDGNGNQATPRELETILRNLGFKACADIICSKFEINLVPEPQKHVPLKLNYEGVVTNYVSRFELETEIIKFLTYRPKRIHPIDFPVVVLQGIGGVGKTTLARRICQLASDPTEIGGELKNFEQNCIWLYAEKEELIIGGLLKVLGLGESSQPSIKEFLAKFYANQLNNAPCLIVFDNVDNYEMVSNYLPLNLKTKVSVLITSNVKCDFGDLGKVRNIEIGYFTEAEFSMFVKEIISNISEDEIKYLNKYTGRIPYLANIACRGLSKWRRHHSEEVITKYFQDNDDGILDGGINMGLNFRKYPLNPQEIVERQINLMRNHEGKDGELAYELLCRLAYCRPDFEKDWLLNFRVVSDPVSISILMDQGFLKKYVLKFKKIKIKIPFPETDKGSVEYISIHRSYQKAVRTILCQNEKEEEQIFDILEIVKVPAFNESFYWDRSLLWESGKKYGDSTIEKLIKKDGIIYYFKHYEKDINVLKCLVEYLKRTRSPKDYIRLALVHTQEKISPLITCKGFNKVIDERDFDDLLQGIKLNKGQFREKTVMNFFVRLVIRNPQWLKQFIERVYDVFISDKMKAYILVYAAREEVLKAVEYLISKGLDVNKKNEDEDTPLHKAKEFNIAEALLKAGANPNIQDKLLQTPLHKMAHRVEMVKLLLSYNADPNIKDKTGKTASDIAKLLQKDEIIQLLKDNSFATKREISNNGK